MPDLRGDPEAPGPSANTPGLGESATGLVASILDYLQARLSLLILEGREARGELLWRTLCWVVGITFLLIAYFATCVGLVGWLSARFSWPWPLTTLGLAGFHLVMGLVFLLAVRRRFREIPFRDSLREWEKDREWLRRHRNRQPPHP